MADPLQSLLGRSCVAFDGKGTGFVVGPGTVLTCAHVLNKQNSVGDEVVVTTFEGEQRPARVAELLRTEDLALLTLENGGGRAVVLAGADAELIEDEKLLVVGYPVFDKALRELASLSVVYDGSSDTQDQRRLQFKGNHVVGGFSGSPLLNLHTGHVVGMVTETRGKTGPLGGWAIPTETIAGKLAGLGAIMAEAAPAWSEALDERQAFIDASSPSYQPVFQHFAQDAARPLEFGTRAVGFVGRDAEMARLRQFLDDAATFAWLLMAGPAGVGKSRLALELCLACRPAWQAGFVEKDQIADLPFWRRWRPNRPTLLVVDYAGPYGAALGELARTLAGKRHRPLFPIRLLLIERQPGTERERADWYETFVGRGSSDRGVTLSRRFPTRDGPDLELGPLPDADLSSILASVAPASFAEADRAGAVARLASFDPEKATLSAILFAQTAAAAGDRDSAIREILRRERQAQWEPAGCTEDDVALLALTTIVGGATRDDLRGRSPWIDRAVAQWSPARFRVLTGQMDKAKLGYLKPNLFGELFVLDWIDRLPDEEVMIAARAMWAISAEGGWGFLIRVVPDFPEHPALRRLIAAPDEPLRAVQLWASAVVDITRRMPARYVGLGEWLQSQIEAAAARQPKDVEIFELMARATFNLTFVYGRAQAYDQARRCRSKFDALLKQHPDKTRALKLALRALMGDVVLLVVEDEQDLNRPLRPAPITFMQSKLRMNEAQKAFDQILRKFPARAADDEFHEIFAAAAFHLVLGYARPGIVISRVWFPASAMLAPDVSEQLAKAEGIYRKFRQTSGKAPASHDIQAFLARSASALAAAYCNAKRDKDIAVLRGEVATLAGSAPDEPRIREELARIDYNLIVCLHRAGRLDAARQALVQLGALAAAHPAETPIGDRRDKATAMLGSAG